MLLMQDKNETTVLPAEGSFPAQVELIISALETGQYDRFSRRAIRRYPYRAECRLRLFSDDPLASPWKIYTRDLNARGLGFISPHRLPLGYGGVVELPHPEAGTLSISCTLIRCREAAPGWYEGSIDFNREQPDLARPVPDE